MVHVDGGEVAAAPPELGFTVTVMVVIIVVVVMTRGAAGRAGRTDASGVVVRRSRMRMRREGNLFGSGWVGATWEFAPIIVARWIRGFRKGVEDVQPSSKKWILGWQQRRNGSSDPALEW